MERARFKIWHTIIDRDLKGCAFDVTPAGYWKLGEGTPHLIQDFMGAARVPASAARWTIAPFCSSFYCDFPKQDHWSFRYPIAWRVHIELARPIPYSTVGFTALPALSEQEDETGVNTLEKEPWMYHQRRAVVIAAFAGVDDEEAIASRLSDADLPKPAEILELTDELYEVRFDLGELRFPDEEASIKALVEKCRAIGAMVHWSDLKPYSEE